MLYIKNDMVTNEGIRASEVRLIDSDGTQLGVMSKEKALQIAEEQGLDLVLIAANGNPPVCKIMDYGRFRFEQNKREKEARKNQNVIEIKEVRLSTGIDEHDLNTKLRQTTKFLADGNKVKVTIFFRGRQMAHSHLGYGVLENFAKRLEEVGVVERSAKLEGRNMIMILAPRKAK